MYTLEASELKLPVTIMRLNNWFKHCFLLLFLTFSFNSFSQQKNSVKIYSGGLKFPGISNENNRHASNSLISLTGIIYERKLNEKFVIGGQFSLWRTPFKNHSFFIGTENPIDSVSVGEIITHSNFKTYDIYGVYTLNLNKKLKLGLKAGPSITKGENQYLRSYMIYSPEPPIDFTFSTEIEKETYFGAFTGLSFDYIFCQGRIPIGVDFNGRFYRNFPFQMNYGLHLGYNF